MLPVKKPVRQTEPSTHRETDAPRPKRTPGAAKLKEMELADARESSAAGNRRLLKKSSKPWM
jgi:hypothetical protein